MDVNPRFLLALARRADATANRFFVDFFERTDWHRRPAGAVVGERGRTNTLVALEELRRRIRTRHYS